MSDIDLSEIKDLTVTDIEELIDSAPDAERETLKSQLRAAELAAGDPRQGVLDATTPATAPPSAPQAPPVVDEDDELPDVVTAAEQDAAAEQQRIDDAAANSGALTLSDLADQQ